MAVNIPGIVAVAVCYAAILIIGIIAGRKTNKSTSNEAVLVADRSLGMFVSIFTMTATMIGGGYICGSAESAARNGLVQTQAPFFYCISLCVAAFTFVPKMRREEYITMFDPFQLKYGKKVGALLCIPQFLGDLFWSAATLAALGSTISIILDLDPTWAIVISAAVAILYTFLGGLYSVAYTDVIQLLFIFFGLILAVPFALINEAVDLSRISDTWLGEVPKNTIGSYIDVGFLCIFGGIPWQSLFQRSLAARDVHVAKVSALVGGFFSLSLGVPSVLMGIAGSAADWNATDYAGELPFGSKEWKFILPLSLNFLTPVWASIIGIGAVAAAVMSSADSCILSTSSVFTKNIYADIIRPQSTEREIIWVLRISVLVVGTLGTLIAIFSDTIYGLYLLCSDLMYVVLFPQLAIVLWVESANAYGCIAGFISSFLLRILAGEAVISLPATIKYPLYDESTNTQNFPHRTFAMLVGTILIATVSLVTNKLFVDELISRDYDVLQCHKQRSSSRPRRPGTTDKPTSSDADDAEHVALKENPVF